MIANYNETYSARIRIAFAQFTLVLVVLEAISTEDLTMHRRTFFGYITAHRNKKLNCCCDSRSYWRTIKPVSVTSLRRTNGCYAIRYFRVQFMNAPKLNPLKRD